MSDLSPPVSPDDHRAGPDAAALSLVEYADYECVYCARALSIVEEVRRELGGRVVVVFRHFPMETVHLHAERAAQAAEAAAAQGRFWEMHEALFAGQRSLADADLVRRARDLGLDVARFEQELASALHASRVRRDFRSGVASGVVATPTFFVNGIRYRGGVSASALVQALEATESGVVRRADRGSPEG
jgi:protein-disulfide isomerase